MHELKGEQLVFDLPFRPALDRENFLVSDSNFRAVDTIDNWPSYSGSETDYVKIICGPPACGKSHLAAVWGLKTGAYIITGTDLHLHALDKLMDEKALVVDGVENIRRDLLTQSANEEILFHLINNARQRRYPLLLTANMAPGHLQIELADLKSRLSALVVATMLPPCDMLMRAVLVKLFTDRQLKTDEKVVAYLVSRLERSFLSLNEIVSKIDRTTLSRKVPITVPMVREIIALNNDLMDDG
jgi:chromosomal replication initiation ATPase DnaA